jgi:hypothetical protein
MTYTLSPPYVEGICGLLLFVGAVGKDWWGTIGIKAAGLLVALSVFLFGYDKVAEIAKTAHRENATGIKLGYLTGEEFGAVVVPEARAHP